MINKKLKINIFLSTILLFAIGTLLHFAYEFFNSNFLVGLITPVNESVFEHLKLTLFPITVWWILFYFLKKEKYSLDKNTWFLGCLFSIIIALIIIPTIYYLVKCGIGKEYTIVNFISLYISLLGGQFIGYHVYKHAYNDRFDLSVFSIIVLTILFFILTLYPPKIPIFKDNQTNTYGIFKNTKQ